MFNKLVLATSNQGKLREIQLTLSGVVSEIISQQELGVTDIPETGLTFIENAILKARNACKNTNLPAIADDSGLIIDAINGEPGLYSARYAGKNCDFKDNINKVLTKLENVGFDLRTAKFYCVMVFLKHEKDPTPKIFDGTWEGKILFSPQGDKGFGYDPIFYVPEYNCSAGELSPAIKNKISHRGQALNKMVNYFLTPPIGGKAG